jgi:type I restriction enzyme S subunit
MADLHYAADNWLGQTPETWSVVPAKSLFSNPVERNHPDDVHLTPSQKFGVLPQSDYMEITGNRVVLNLNGADNMRHVEPGDFVSHLRSFQGGLEYSPYKGKVSSAYTVLRPKRPLEPRFYKYLFKSGRYVQGLSTTTEQLRDGQSIRYEQFALLPLPHPPLEEQKAIADFLDNELTRIDSLIEKQHDLIARLKERKNALLKMMILGLGRSSSTSHMTQHEWLAGIPADWKVSKIGREFSLTLGKTLNAATNKGEVIVPYLRAGNVQDAGIDLQEVKTIGVTLKEKTDLALVRGDVVVVEGGAGFGRSDVLVDTLDGWVFQNHVIRARSKGTVMPEYLDLYIKYLRSIGHFEKLSAYATIPSISSDALGRIPIPKPPKEVAKELVQSLTNDLRTHDTLIAKSFELIAGLQARRSALVSNAVTGKIDVRGEN